MGQMGQMGNSHQAKRPHLSHQAKRYPFTPSSEALPIKRSAPIYPIKGSERVLKGIKGLLFLPFGLLGPFFPLRPLMPLPPKSARKNFLSEVVRCGASKKGPPRDSTNSTARGGQLLAMCRRLRLITRNYCFAGKSKPYICLNNARTRAW